MIRYTLTAEWRGLKRHARFDMTVDARPQVVSDHSQL